MTDQDLTLFNRKRRRPKADSVRKAVESERAEFERRRRVQLARAAMELDNLDAQILQLMLKLPGLSQRLIGDQVGLTRQAVAHRVRAPKFKRALHEANRAALEIYQGNQAAAARKIGLLIHSDDPAVAIRACIAHLWPMIHRNPADATGSDFVRFISEAYEQVQAKRAARPDPDSPND